MAETHSAHQPADHAEANHEPASKAAHADAAVAHKNSQASMHREPAHEASQNHKAPKTSAHKILPSDVRVLIDISGSMKKTDPQNLRKPALNLIARLLPDKSKAGIWTFGQSVNMLMPHRVVDAEWRKQAAPKSNQINSIAFFTNIGKALEEVSFDRKNPSADYQTHIVLLTDGVVDISKEAVANVKERQRILTNLLPGLKSAGYIVHTIALSDDADADLLKKISIATDGVSITAGSADELTSTFLKIFDQAVPAERVPLEDNGFLVDSSIKEFTALIFRKAGVEKTIITAPDGTEFSTSSAQSALNWYRTDTYDLITVLNPKVGKWKIKTDITPQSRVTVVSNLQLVVTPMKTNLRINDSLMLSYSFLENDKVITNKDFLGLLEASAIIAKQGENESSSLDLTAATPPENGQYHQSLKVMKDAGDYELHLYVDGKTFKREFKYSFSVIGSVLKVSHENTADDHGKTTHNYTIAINEKLVDLKKTKVIAAVTDAHNNTSETALELNNGHWLYTLSPEQYGNYKVVIHATGVLIDGSELDETVTAEKFTYEEKPIEKTVEAPAVEEHSAAPAEPKHENMATDKLWIYASIGFGVLLTLILSYFGYRILKSKSVEDADLEKPIAPIKKPIEKEPSSNKSEKTEIDLSGDDLAHISMSDDLMSENAFPLDNMEEPSKDDLGMDFSMDLNLDLDSDKEQKDDEKDADGKEDPDKPTDKDK